MTKFLALVLLVVASIAVGCKKADDAATTPATTTAPPAESAPAETPAP